MAIDDITASAGPALEKPEEPEEKTVTRLEALHGRRLVLTEESVTVEGDKDGWGGWSVAFLPQIAAIRVAPGRKERSTLLWGLVGVFAAIWAYVKK